MRVGLFCVMLCVRGFGREERMNEHLVRDDGGGGGDKGRGGYMVLVWFILVCMMYRPHLFPLSSMHHCNCTAGRSTVPRRHERPSHG